MADKIRVVKPNTHNLIIVELDTYEVDLDKFCKDYRKAIFSSVSGGSVITPTEYFWEWIKEQ